MVCNLIFVSTHRCHRRHHHHFDDNGLTLLHWRLCLNIFLSIIFQEIKMPTTTTTTTTTPKPTTTTTSTTQKPTTRRPFTRGKLFLSRNF